MYVVYVVLYNYYLSVSLPGCGGDQSHYTQDYTSVGAVLSFQQVFAIMFNGCTGIMGEYIPIYPHVHVSQGTVVPCI